MSKPRFLALTSVVPVGINVNRILYLTEGKGALRTCIVTKKQTFYTDEPYAEVLAKLTKLCNQED